MAVSIAMRTLSCYLSSSRSILDADILRFSHHSMFQACSPMILSTEQYQTYEHANQLLCNLEGVADTIDRTYPKVVLILLT